MGQSLYFETEIHFNVGPARVWDALTNPDKTKQYMYGCVIKTDWEIGGPLVWEADFNGNPTVVVKGELLDIKTFKLLEFTVFVPGSGVADIPQNYITSTYTLTRDGQGTRLLVRLGDYALVDNGIARCEDTTRIWEQVTPKLIEIAEAREPQA